MQRILLVVLMLCATQLAGQEKRPVIFNNYSLEDIPKDAKPPIGWYDCSAPGMTPIDVHPSGQFGVEKPPVHGNSYVGFVTRDNNTREMFGQQLPAPLQAGTGYSFKVFIGRSRFYLSRSLKTTLEANYVAPVRLRIWGGFKNCDCYQLLAESPPVEHFDWKSYQFLFVADKAYTHLQFEVAPVFDAPQLADNGHLLVDNLGPLLPLLENTNDPIPTPIQEIAYSKNLDLNTFIKTNGQKIKYNNSYLFYQKDFFKDASGQEWIANLPLWQITQALVQHPNKQLIIAVDESDNLSFYIKHQQLEAVLLQAGLKNGTHFSIEKWRRKSKKHDWMWPVNKNGLSMRIIDR